MWFRAFFPEPPTPMTLIRAKLSIVGFIFGSCFYSYFNKVIMSYIGSIIAENKKKQSPFLGLAFCFFMASIV